MKIIQTLFTLLCALLIIQPKAQALTSNQCAYGSALAAITSSTLAALHVYTQECKKANKKPKLKEFAYTLKELVLHQNSKKNIQNAYKKHPKLTTLVLTTKGIYLATIAKLIYNLLKTETKQNPTITTPTQNQLLQHQNQTIAPNSDPKKDPQNLIQPEKHIKKTTKNECEICYENIEPSDTTADNIFECNNCPKVHARCCEKSLCCPFCKAQKKELKQNNSIKINSTEESEFKDFREMVIQEDKNFKYNSTAINRQFKQEQEYFTAFKNLEPIIKSLIDKKIIEARMVYDTLHVFEKAVVSARVAPDIATDACKNQYNSIINFIYEYDDTKKPDKISSDFTIRTFGPQAKNGLINFFEKSPMQNIAINVSIAFHTDQLKYKNRRPLDIGCAVINFARAPFEGILEVLKYFSLHKDKIVDFSHDHEERNLFIEFLKKCAVPGCIDAQLDTFLPFCYEISTRT